MQKDAKLGLVVGVGLVILIAVVFFRREALPIPGGAPASVSAAGPSPAPAPRGQYRPVRAKPTQRPDPSVRETSDVREALAGD